MSPGDAATLVAEVHGLELAVVRPLQGGAVGAHEVAWPGGGRGVMKQIAGRRDRRHALRALQLIEPLRAAGYPAPATVAATDAPHALVMVQAWMPGEPEDVVDHALVDDVLTLNALQAGRARDNPSEEPWGRFVLRALLHGLSRDDGFCIHETLRLHTPRTAVLLERIRAAAVGLDQADFATGDIVHGDFHHRNILVRDRRVTGVVDWDSARAGDAAFDLVTLAFCSAVATCEAGAVDRLWARVLAERPPPVARAYVAFLALRQVDWFIRHDGREVDAWTTTAETLLDRI